MNICLASFYCLLNTILVPMIPSGTKLFIDLLICCLTIPDSRRKEFSGSRLGCHVLWAPSRDATTWVSLWLSWTASCTPGIVNSGSNCGWNLCSSWSHMLLLEKDAYRAGGTVLHPSVSGKRGFRVRQGRTVAIDAALCTDPPGSQVVWLQL